MQEPIRSAAMIVNAKSRKGRRLYRHACAAMTGLPFEVDAHAVRDPDDLDRVTSAVLGRRPDLLILGGGDGTISGLVDRLVGTGVTLAVLPLDVAGAVEVIRSGRRRRIDLGMIDGDYFANCAAIGISPQIAETVPHALKKILGRVGYLGWAAIQFGRFKPFMLIVGEGAEERRLKVVEVRISNGPYHGGTWLVDEAGLATGEIVVQAVVGHVKRRLIKNWAASVIGHRARHDDTVSFAGESLKIATEPPLPISIDGEVLARTPVTARVAKGVIEVIAPA